EPWRVPTNTIHDPLIGFTAVRGVRSWLSAQPSVQRERPDPVPDQLYCWALGDTPFQTFIAAPMPDASNVVWHLGGQLATNYNPALRSLSLGAIQLQTNN